MGIRLLRGANDGSLNKDEDSLKLCDTWDPLENRCLETLSCILLSRLVEIIKTVPKTLVPN
jgi:hypothetical protein